MLSQFYNIGSTFPYEIFPNGAPEAANVTNNGTKTVYVQDVRSGIGGYALNPGASVQWAQGRPLFAYIDAGNVGTLFISGAATVAPFSQVATTNVFDLVTSLVGTVAAHTDVTNVSRYGSLTFSATGTGTTYPAYIEIEIRWYADVTANVLVGLDSAIAPTSNTVTLTTPFVVAVKGPYMAVYVTPTTTSAYTVYAYGQNDARAEAYYQGGSIGNSATEFHAYLTTTSAIATGGGQLLWYPGSHAGHALLSWRMPDAAATGSVVVTVGAFNGSLIYRYLISAPWSADATYAFEFDAPRTPLRLEWRNFASATQRVEAGLAYRKAA